jgi:phenylpropionate dioxygenase-like ring-hydroxylating dioxygenase large terminal subunit
MFSGDVSEGLLGQWYVVADAADLGGEPIPVTLLGRSFVLWRDHDGRPSAAADRCPHREAPLSDGRVDAGCIVCPYHGWTFGPDGACKLIPSATPGTPIPSAARLAMVEVREQYGVIWLCPGVPVADPPLIVEDADPAYRGLTAGMETWTASATRMADNFCDVAHFPYVHAGTIGGDMDPVVDSVDIEELGDGFVGYRYSVEVLDEHGERIGQDMSTSYHLPFTVRSNTRYTSGSRVGQDRVLLLCTTPVDDATSLFTFIVWRNHDHEVPAADVLAFDRAIGAEDKLMLETIPGALPLAAGNDGTVSVKADRLSVRWRQGLRALVQTAPVAESADASADESAADSRG